MLDTLSYLALRVDHSRLNLLRFFWSSDFERRLDQEREAYSAQN